MPVVEVFISPQDNDRLLMSQLEPVALKLGRRIVCKAVAKDRLDYRNFCPYGAILFLGGLVPEGHYQKVRITTELIGEPVKAKRID
ncbi:MAG: hypothetical protein ACYTF6_13530 [Planctomycetota bacterium]|jgi:hypothetical protein